MAVTGVVAPDAVLTNAGGRAGDALVLTKPLGTGAVAAAIKRGLAESALVERAVAVMTELNDRAAEQARDAGAHALTDVTGFGLLGHLHELAAASGARRNRADAETYTSFAAGVSEPRRRLACDTMTSGGLLAAVPADRAAQVGGALIGRLVAGGAGTITVS